MKPQPVTQPKTVAPLERDYTAFLTEPARVSALKEFLDAAAVLGRRKRLALAESDSKPAA